MANQGVDDIKDLLEEGKTRALAKVVDFDRALERHEQDQTAIGIMSTDLVEANRDKKHLAILLSEARKTIEQMAYRIEELELMIHFNSKSPAPDQPIEDVSPEQAEFPPTPEPSEKELITAIEAAERSWRQAYPIYLDIAVEGLGYYPRDMNFADKISAVVRRERETLGNTAFVAKYTPPPAEPEAEVTAPAAPAKPRRTKGFPKWVKEMTFEKLGLDRTVAANLSNVGVNTVPRLIETLAAGRDEFLKLKQIGPKSLANVLERFADKGLDKYLPTEV